MKTLERYWHRNERPGSDLTQSMRAKHLSPLAELALGLAVQQIASRRCSTLSVEEQTDELAKLSLAFCRALGEMHDAVPESPPPVMSATYAQPGIRLSPALLARIDAICSMPAPWYKPGS